MKFGGIYDHGQAFPMIVELFGPPAAGKTTCAFMLADALRARGQRVDLCMSLRPGEQENLSREPRLLAAQRLLRPIHLLISDLSHAFRDRDHAVSAWQMLSTMPPRGLLNRVRLYRYLLHLYCAREAVARAPYVVLIDQGFVQAFASLVLLSGCQDEAIIDRALASLPRPDLLIGLQPPDAVLRERLAARLAAQGWTSRWLELSLEESLGFATVIADLGARLRRQGLEPVWLSSPNKDAIETIVTRIERILRVRQQHGDVRQGHRASEAVDCAPS